MANTRFELVDRVTSANVYEVPGVDRVFLVMPAQVGRPGDIDPADVLLTSIGAFCFVPRRPQSLAHLADTVISHVHLTPAARSAYLFWVSDPDAATSTHLRWTGVSDGSLRDPIDLPFRNAQLHLPDHTTHVAISASGDGFTFTGGPKLVPARDADAALDVASVEMPFSEAGQGLVRFDVDLTAPALAALDVGLRVSWNGPDGEGPRSVRYPVFELDAGATLPVRASFDADRQEATERTYYALRQGEGAAGQPVGSYYRTVTGERVQLTPLFDGPDGGPRLDFCARPGDGGADAVYLAPRGEFLLGAPAGPDGAGAELLCGLLGTERLAFVPGADRATGTVLRFEWLQPAWVPRFPLPAASPVGPPSAAGAPLMQADYGTSWVRLASAGAPIVYGAQPVGAALFGHDGTVADDASPLLGHVDPGSVLPATDPPLFPLVPYAGVAPADADGAPSAATIEQLERAIVGPTRQRVLDQAAGGRRGSARDAAADTVSPARSYLATTPSGVLTEVSCREQDCRFTRIVLGQTRAREGERSASPYQQLAFVAPSPALEDAFRSSQLFLVVANAYQQNLVREGGAFTRRLDVAGWGLEAAVGESPGYGDYANVMIVKRVKGPLYDPDGRPADNLVTNAAKWTQSETFAAPSVPGPSCAPDEDQLVALSAWLEEYFRAAAAEQDTRYFAHFNEIARSPDWTGILILRARIARLPGDLAGIAAGIEDPSRFYAHHVGVELNPVAYDASRKGQGIRIDGQSSLFGLIHYVDPEYRPSEPPQPVAPPPGEPYAFRVLSLKVLFENTAVKDFASTAQITLNRILDAPVTRMGGSGRDNTIVLAGSYQTNHGEPVYSLGSSEDSTFYFDGPVVNKIEITGAQMSTRDAGEAGGETSIWFGFTGFIDYHALSLAPGPEAGAGGQPAPFDLFSFGNAPGKDERRKGLAFDNLGLQMTFPEPGPKEGSPAAGSEPLHPDFELVAREMRFDVTRSTPRPESLYSQFALSLEGLVVGTGQRDPRALGYLDVRTALPLAGVGGRAWHALEFRLDMGSPGALAGDVGLVSRLLLAWSAAGGGAEGVPAAVGLSLPGAGGGAKLISLQSVLTLAIGSLDLVYDAGDGVARDAKHGGFVLMLTDIALRFLGLLKIPPSGATDFYLFGNPERTTDASGLGWYAAYNREPLEGNGKANGKDTQT